MDLQDIFKTQNMLNESEAVKISYYIIKYCKDKKIDLTNLKLNKLLYFVNIKYMLENNGNPLFNEEFLAWRHGPVLQSVYERFYFGITLVSVTKLEIIMKQLSDKKIKIINEVLEKKGQISAWDLVLETHVSNGPWEVIYNNNKDINGICKTNIPHQLIYNFYKEYRHGV